MFIKVATFLTGKSSNSVSVCVYLIMVIFPGMNCKPWKKQVESTVSKVTGD